MAKTSVFAAIDIGSSKISMKIFQLSKTTGISVVDDCVINLLIGKEAYIDGKLSYELTGEICMCLDKFKRIMTEYGVTDYICYATSAVRNASNSEYIRDQILIRTGLKVGIVSNEEERFLHNKALAFNMENFDSVIDEGAVIIDVSSGSLQVSSYENSELKFSQNLPLGSMKVISLMSGVNNNTVSISKLLREYTANMLELYRNSFFADPKHRSVILIGNQTAKIREMIGSEGDEADRARLDALYDEITDMGINDLSDKYGISVDEAKQLVSSMLLFKPFINKKKTVYMPNVETTDGICIEYAEKNKIMHTKHIFTNDIISSAMYYASRYNIDTEHVNKILGYCEEIFKALSKRFGLSKSDLLLLKVAAIFSHTGIYININDFNVYSYDIKRANMLLGLSNKDNDTISYIILFQNGVFDHEEYKYMPKNRKLQISKLAAILSLAQSIDFEYRQIIDHIKVVLRNGEMNINAYTDYDITMEQWQFDENERFFEEVFGIQAKLNKKSI